MVLLLSKEYVLRTTSIRVYRVLSMNDGSCNIAVRSNSMIAQEVLPEPALPTTRRTSASEYEARLKPGFAALEQLLKLEKGSLSFTGKTEGTGTKRHYQLALKGQTAPDGKPKTIWVGVNKDGSLFLYEKKATKPGAPGTTEKPEYEIKPKAEV